MSSFTGRRRTGATPAWVASLLGFWLCSCLAPEPPSYQAPERTPPVLLLNGAVPRVTGIIDRALGEESIDFSIGVRSEDAGDFLVGSVFLNYGSETEEYVTQLLRKPSVFDDTSRSISFPYVPQKPGCHVLVLLVTHLQNFDELEKKPRDLQDVGLATWWLQIRTQPLGDPPTCTTFGGG